MTFLQKKQDKQSKCYLHLIFINISSVLLLLLFTKLQGSNCTSIVFKYKMKSNYHFNFIHSPFSYDHHSFTKDCKVLSSIPSIFREKRHNKINLFPNTEGYTNFHIQSCRKRFPLIPLNYKEDKKGDDKLEPKNKIKEEEKEKGFLIQAVWYLSEGLGTVLGNLNSLTSSTDSRQKKMEYETYLANRSVMNLDQSIELLRADYDKVYFVTGDLNLDIYDENCIFADPFGSFTGLDRFKKNLDNLGGYLEDVTLKLRDFAVESNEIEKTSIEPLPNDLMERGYRNEQITMVKASWNFKCIVTLLPWKPLLACKGSTKHFFDKSTGRIVKHDEGWEIETLDALKQLLKPSKKLS